MSSVPRGRKKKNIPKSTSEMSKEMLIETLRKKKECNARALAIVERLCEPLIPEEDWFLSSMEFINQCHFEDIIVERAILKLCGYPLCKNRLENVPAKKYHISTKQNKVYDITERKNFCSSGCYKAGMYLKNQLLTSPLWYRDQEIIPKFKLLPCSTTASMGEEVVFLPERDQLKKEVLAEKKRESELQKVVEKIESLNLESDSNIDKTDEETVNVLPQDDTSKNTSDEQLTEKLVEDNTLKIDDKKESPRETKSKTKKEVEVDPVKRVEQCIYEWFTFDTVLYLYGEEKVKDIMKDRKDEIKSILGSKPLLPGYSDKIDRMITFYSLLDQQFDSDSGIKDLKPLPDYSAIKEDGKKLEVKVKAFYSGQLEMKECDIVEKKTGEENAEENEIYLPTVDAHAQNTLRMKILMDRFNKVIPELIRTFTTAHCFEVSELRQLVSHFTLSAHNITFKPGEWYLIGFIMIKLMSLKNRQLASLLNSPNGKTHVTLLLMNYGLPADYLENVLDWLMNVDGLIKKLS
ncbi:UNVERIFIED_CONTAM: hypothetical protein PYX00_005793 [Menopon gallinae]|uniref:RNA polymerase II subunit B1 CTD phosphatase RPAP2 homolog n=1 Tax=Menopon gallinae TaxID=328185 RepID=A0AAW2HSV7_9NEOP